MSGARATSRRRWRDRVRPGAGTGCARERGVAPTAGREAQIRTQQGERCRDRCYDDGQNSDKPEQQRAYSPHGTVTDEATS